MPDGREYPLECVHWLGEGDRVESLPGRLGDVIVDVATGERRHVGNCEASGGRRDRRELVVDAGDRLGLASYYSSWIVDAVSTHTSFGGMTSNWTVPRAPKSRGPVPGMSSVYLFNGLEDGGGVPGASTMILQPVLSHGKSGCVLDPLAGWRFTAFYVTGSGRAYCGRAIAVSEGDRLQGRMELAEGSQDTWVITADAGSKGVSSYTASLPGLVMDAAYIVLEGMVVYSCDALPREAVEFTANALRDAQGHAVTPAWQPQVRHPECAPKASIAGHDVRLEWSSSASVALQKPAAVFV